MHIFFLHIKLAFPLFGFWFYLICRNILLVAWGIVFFWKFDILKIQNPKELSVCIFSLRDFFSSFFKRFFMKVPFLFFFKLFSCKDFFAFKHFRLIFNLKIKKKYQNFIHNTFEIKIFSTKLLFYIIRLFFQKFWQIFQKIISFLKLQKALKIA